MNPTPPFPFSAQSRAPYAFLRGTIDVLICDSDEQRVARYLKLFGVCHLFVPHVAARPSIAAEALGASRPPHVCLIATDFGPSRVRYELIRSRAEKTAFVCLGDMADPAEEVYARTRGALGLLNASRSQSLHALLSMTLRAFIARLVGAEALGSAGMPALVETLITQRPDSVGRWAAAAGVEQRSLHRTWRQAVGIEPVHVLRLVRMYFGALAYFEKVCLVSLGGTTEVLQDSEYVGPRRYWEKHQRALREFLGR